MVIYYWNSLSNQKVKINLRSYTGSQNSTVGLDYFCLRISYLFAKTYQNATEKQMGEL